MIERLRRRTKTGRPCASREWIKRWEEQSGLVLLPKKRGRKLGSGAARPKRELPGQLDPGIGGGGVKYPVPVFREFFD